MDETNLVVVDDLQDMGFFLAIRQPRTIGCIVWGITGNFLANNSQVLNLKKKNKYKNKRTKLKQILGAVLLICERKRYLTSILKTYLWLAYTVAGSKVVLAKVPSFGTEIQSFKSATHILERPHSAYHPETMLAHSV